ncbi:MAG TPA: tetratricopeptide repeat protein [Ignavibacteria bacterium]|nr:tetratricopeptide repeat protein [Ignavibacteria bacterium]
MKIFCVIFLILYSTIGFSQSNLIEIEIPEVKPHIIKAEYYNNNLYLCTEKQIFNLNLYSNSIRSVDFPYLFEEEYIKDLVLGSKGVGYLLTSKYLYKVSTNLNEFNRISLPDKVSNNILRKFESDESFFDYNIYLINDELMLSVSCNPYSDIIFYLGIANETWIHFENEYIDLKNVINKNICFYLSSENINNNHIDSIFIYTNAMREKMFLMATEIPNSYESESTSASTNRSTLQFINEDIGFYYNINNQYIYATATSEFSKSSKYSFINFYTTTDRGNNWNINTSFSFNDINLIKFFTETDGYMVCSKINKDGEFKSSSTENIKYVFDDIYEPKDFDYFLMKTTDKGISWVETNFNFNTFEPCNVNIKKGSDNSYWLIIKNSIFKSSDGYNWVFENNNLPFENEELNFIPISNSECLIFDNEHIWKINSIQNYSNEIYQIEKNTKINDDFLSEFQNNLLLKESFQFNEERLNAFSLYNHDSFSVVIPLLKSLIEKDLYYKKEYLFKLGYSLIQIENYEEAIYYLEEAFSFDSNSIIANNLGFAYQNVGNFEEAFKYYKIAVEMNPETELYKNNLDFLYKITYKLSNNELEFLQTYFPTHKVGSKMLYWQRNNSASYYEKNFVDSFADNWSNIVINYFSNLISYQINEIKLTESGEYKLIGNSLAYFGLNKMLGNYSYKLISFPLEENLEWITFGFPLKVISTNESVTTLLGKFTNCLMLGNEYYREYYAPGIGLVLVVSKIGSIDFQLEKELISFDLIK